MVKWQWRICVFFGSMNKMILTTSKNRHQIAKWISAIVVYWGGEEEEKNINSVSTQMRARFASAARRWNFIYQNILVHEIEINLYRNWVSRSALRPAEKPTHSWNFRVSHDWASESLNLYHHVFFLVLAVNSVIIIVAIFIKALTRW